MLYTTSIICLVGIISIMAGLISGTFVEKIVPYQRQNLKKSSRNFYIDFFGVTSGIISSGLAGMLLTSYLLPYGNIFGAFIGCGSLALLFGLIEIQKNFLLPLFLPILMFRLRLQKN